MRTLFVAIIVLLFTSGTVSADTSPPFKREGAEPEPTLRAPLTIDLRIGDLRVQFERTTLRDVQKAVGSGRIAHRGDAGDSTYWLCYEGISNSTPVRLWFIAGEINGPDQTIGKIQLLKRPHGVPPDRDCPSLQQSRQAIKFSQASVIGSTTDSAISIFGKPSLETVKSVAYVYLGKIPGKFKGEQVDFYRFNALELHLSAGVVVGVSASQSTTY